MKRAVAMIATLALMAGAASAIGVTAASAKACPTTSLKAAVKCFNVRADAQHKQIVTLQNQVKALNKSQTVAGFSARLAAVENHFNCFYTASVSEFTTNTNPWGDSFSVGSQASGYLPGRTSWTYLDLAHPSQPNDQSIWSFVVNGC